MRKINVFEFSSLDGVIQSAGGPEKETSSGLAHGGWWRPHADPTPAAFNVTESAVTPKGVLL